MWLTGLILTLGIVWVLAYQGAGASLWIGALFAGLTAVTLATDIQWYVSLPLWLAAAAAVLLLGVPRIRRRHVTAPLLRQFRRVMPAMSSTEREALEAGTIWWDAELFSGRPHWGRLLRLPRPHLSAEEQAFLDGPVERLCRMLDDWRITHQEHDLPPEVWDFIRREGFFGLIIPRRYGGKGFSAQAHSAVVMKLASRSIVAAITVMVPNSLGPGKLLLNYGTREQRDRYLPRLARGEEIPCFALTGPDAGSDAGAIPDRGVVCHGEWQGRRVLGVRLNWEKRYITLGPVCTLLGLAFRLYDPDHLLGEEEDLGITLALVPRDTPGVEIGERHVPLDIPFQNGPNRGRDVFVPMEQLIGGTRHIGNGWRMLVECLSEGRAISLPSLSVGAGKLASRYTGAYAAIRQQFGMPIGRFEGIEKPLARIAGLSYQMDAARQLTLSGLDLGEKPSVISAIVKYHLTEKYRQCINDAMDIQGGSGICLGPRNLLGRVYQAIPIAITVEGANILTRSMIIFGQGAVRAHPWVLKEFLAAQNPDRGQGLADFDHALFGHVGFLLGNLARSLFLGLTRGRFSQAPVTGPSRRHFQRLNWMSAAFALCADVAMMTLGGSLKRKERLSARLGDILSELYLCSAVLKRFEDQGRPAEDEPLLAWTMEQSLYQMQEAFRLLFRNLPWRPLGWVLRLLVFPTGAPFTEPGDRLDHEVAQLLLRPGEARDRLTAGIFVTDDPAFRQGQFERAFAQAARVAPIEKTLREARRNGLIDARHPLEQARQAHAQGLIDDRQLAEMETMQRLRAEVIAVDSFPDYGHRHVLEQDFSVPRNVHAIEEAQHARTRN
ncbi:MAG TPA: acyl-CoA dehydrogenase [Gammaproteobacteria bacterium]|nr:acyl-CoA dehydrogenase [Gammaproteobacteria bacterium]